MRIIIAMLFSTLICSAAIADSKWAIDKPMASIPDTPLAGAIFGKAFASGSVTLNEHTLTFTSKGKVGGWPESELIIFVNMKEGKKKWMITPASDGHQPHIHMRFAKKGKTFPGTLIFMEEYSMKLVFTKVTKTKAKGRIHISLPDYKKSYLVGSFTANIQ